MTREEQKEFVTYLADRIKEDILAAIRSEKVPEEWDGHELRCLVADKAEDAAGMSVIRKEPRCKRKRDYRNTLLITDLV